MGVLSPPSVTYDLKLNLSGTVISVDASVVQSKNNTVLPRGALGSLGLGGGMSGPPPDTAPRQLERLHHAVPKY